MAGMDAGPYAHRGDMRARANATIANTSARANRTDMGAAVHAVAVHTGARLDHISDMSACTHAAITRAGAGANRADMGTRTHAMAADMRADTNAQHFHARTDIGEGQCGCEQGERDEADGQGFHGTFLQRVTRERPVYFISGNARSDGAIPASSWRGAGPRKGMKIFAVGAAMLLAAYAIRLLMPNGT